MINIPERYRDKSLENFDDKSVSLSFKQQASKVFSSGKSLALLGNCGVGKTHLAVAMLNIWCEQNKHLKQDFDSASRYFAYFLPSNEFFMELKSTFDLKDKSELDIIADYGNRPLLIFDDLGSEKVTDWSRQVFYTLIDYRYREMKQTIITSNLTLNEIAEKFDDRIPSRLCEMGEVITLKGEDRRLRS